MEFPSYAQKYRSIIGVFFVFFIQFTIGDVISTTSDLQTLTLSQENTQTSWGTPLMQPMCNGNGTTVYLASSNELSKALVLTNWGFSIDPSATISRVNITITRSQSGTAFARDWTICVINQFGCQSAVISGTSYPSNSVPDTHSYIFNTNLPNAALVNGASFGFKFQVAKQGGTGGATTITLECAQIDITYTVPLTTSPLTTSFLTTGAPITSGLITTNERTTGAITTNSRTSGAITTQQPPSTTGGSPPVTTAAVPPVTTSVAQVTTGAAQGSTTRGNSVTTGRAVTTSVRVTTGQRLTTSPGVTTAPGLTSGTELVTSTDGNALSPSDSNGGNKSSVPIIAGAVGGGVVLILVIVIVAVVATRGKRNTHKKLQSYPSMISEMGLMKTPKLSENPIKVPGKTYSSVKDVGIASDQNSKFRKQMEDEHVVVDKYGGVDTDGYFAVYDGHGGKAAAEYVKEHLHENILKEAASKPIPEALYDAYMSTDKELKSKGEKSGCTSVSAIIKKTADGKRTLFVANAGDARITLRRGGKGIRMTKDHKVTDEAEIKRIEGRGGMIFGGKVGASLAVTRAFGDSEMRDWVIAEPELNQTDLTPDDTHLIIACDGLWDVVSDQEAVDLIGRDYTAQESADKLLQYALAHETKDNVSVVVLKL